MPLMESLIKIIEAELAKKRTTVEDFAASVGITRQYLNKILRGKSVPTLAVAARLVEICGGKLEIKPQGKKSA